MSRSSTPKIIIRDRVYVPLREVYDKEAVKQTYTKRFYEEANCKRCEYLQDRHSHMCDACPNFKEEVKMYAIKSVGEITYLGMPIGDKRNIEKVAGIDFNDFQIIDKRVTAPFDYPIKFILKLYPYQEKLQATFLKKKYGMIEAPPRTGKTAIALSIAVKLGQRMVMIADQHEFLQQFLWHIEGNPEEGIPKCTNLPELQKKYKKKLYGFPKTDEDFENFQFMVMTYQGFLSEVNGKNRLKRLMANVGTVAIDEVHSAAASEYSKTLNRFYTRYKFGVTGTVERKDGRHYILKRLLGPVTARTTVETLAPTVYIHDTGCKYRSPPKLWVYAMKKLANDEKRNKIIVDQVFKDLKAGHSIVIPVSFTKHITELVNEINRRAGKKIAAPFRGGGTKKNKEERKEILRQAKTGEIRVVVGIRRLLQRGLNVPKWSAIYTVIPISNEPNYRQETRRVCTPVEGKQPIVRLFYEESMGQSVGCARACVRHMKEFNYVFSQEPHTQACLEILSQNKRGGYRDADNFEVSAIADFMASMNSD